MFDFMLNDEEKKLRQEAVDFIKKEVPNELLKAMDRDEIEYPYDYVRKLGAANLLGLRFPKEWGGRGLGWSAEVAVLEEFGTLGTSLACLYSLPSIIGDAIALFGTDAQRAKYLKPTLEGKLICAEALTEPRGGSDFFGAATTARRDGGDWIINGQKRFIVGAEGADWFLVYAVTDPEAAPHKRISCFMVPRDAGVETKYIYGLMGVRGGGAGRVIFNDVRVPERYALNGINGGFDVFVRMMIPERLGTAAMTVGSVRPAIEIATRYTSMRKAFGTQIMNFQAVGFKVADSVMLLDAVRSLVYTTARAIDSEKVHPNRMRRMVSESKKFVTESCWQIANNCMQVMGGIGYTNVYPLERIVRDIRLSMIWVGSNEIMQLIIQNEWYKEYLKVISKEDVRDVELDAVGAHEPGEKIYE